MDTLSPSPLPLRGRGAIGRRCAELYRCLFGTRARGDPLSFNSTLTQRRAAPDRPSPAQRERGRGRGLRRSVGGKRQRAFISATVASSIRLEKPHSLSYQLLTFTRRPDTLVSVASNTEEWGLWLKSTDTSGSSV